MNIPIILHNDDVVYTDILVDLARNNRTRAGNMLISRSSIHYKGIVSSMNTPLMTLNALSID